MSANPIVPQYQITTIDDLLKIPSDKLERCLRDIQYGIEIHHLVFGSDSEGVSMGSIVWVDDDSSSVDMNVNGEPFMKLEVTSRAPEGVK